MNLANPFSWTPLLLQAIVYPFTWIAFRFFSHIKILGRENPKGLPGGAIFAPNHSSELDPILIPATLPLFSDLFPMFYISRERSFYDKHGVQKYLYGGLFFKTWGAYPVRVGLHDYEVAMHHHIDILKKGHSVCIFPEGKKTIDGGVGEGKAGVAYLLWKTGRPVIPVAMRGHYKMTGKEFLKRKRTITVSYGKPLTLEDVFGSDARLTIEPSHDELKAAAQVIMSRIREMYRAI